MIELTSVGAVLERLGRPAVEQMTGRTRQSLSNWKAANRFPPDTYLVLGQALAAKGYSAPPTLWGIRKPIQSQIAQTQAP